MAKKNLLEKKFEDLDILKGFLTTYSEDYRENIMWRIEVITKEISSYLNNTYRDLKEFTIEEVSKYNGKDGMPAYVIINGTVYDTVDVPQWSGGNHFGLVAGVDLTEEFSNCHSNSTEILEKLRVVGVLKS